MSDDQKPKIEPGIYRNRKTGNLYFFAGEILKHSETLEWMVEYYSLKGDGQKWTRPLANFLEEKEPGNPQSTRFVKVLDWKLPNILPAQELKKKTNSIFNKSEREICYMIQIYESTDPSGTLIIAEIDGEFETHRVLLGEIWDQFEVPR
jgi:hypothetical protein